MEKVSTWNKTLDEIEIADPYARPWLMRHQCMHCHGDRRFVACRKETARQITSGLCPSCLHTHFPDIAAEILARATQHEAAA